MKGYLNEKNNLKVVSDTMLGELKQCFLEAYDDNQDGKIEIREVKIGFNLLLVLEIQKYFTIFHVGKEVRQKFCHTHVFADKKGYCLQHMCEKDARKCPLTFFVCQENSLLIFSTN